MFRLYQLSRLISASRIRFIVDFVRQQSDYYYDSIEEEQSMKVPINQKFIENTRVQRFLVANLFC